MSQRRGACPALFTPMQTGDGLLARIVPAERITPGAFAAFCAAARRHGNGTIEVSARGSMQVRGLTAASAPRFADEVAALDIAALGVPVLSDPLPDDPVALIDAGAMAAKLRTAIAKTDLALAGDATTATPLGSIPVEAVTEIVVEVLRTIAAHGDLRASDVLRVDGLGAFSKLPHLQSDLFRLTARPPVEMIGVHPLRDGRRALGVGLAFGHADAKSLVTLAESAAAHGARAIQPAPARALLLVGISEHNIAAMTHEAERLGFVTRTDDPRRRIVACPGAPACASGFIAARAIASEIAETMAEPWSGTIHISGCAKGCAHPRPAALTIVGTERGCGIVEHGTARAATQTHVDPQDLTTCLAHRLREHAHV